MIAGLHALSITASRQAQVNEPSSAPNSTYKNDGNVPETNAATSSNGTGVPKRHFGDLFLTAVGVKVEPGVEPSSDAPQAASPALKSAALMSSASAIKTALNQSSISPHSFDATIVARPGSKLSRENSASARKQQDSSQILASVDPQATQFNVNVAAQQTIVNQGQPDAPTSTADLSTSKDEEKRAGTQPFVDLPALNPSEQINQTNVQTQGQEAFSLAATFKDSPGVRDNQRTLGTDNKVDPAAALVPPVSSDNNSTPRDTHGQNQGTDDSPRLSENLGELAGAGQTHLQRVTRVPTSKISAERSTPDIASNSAHEEQSTTGLIEDDQTLTSIKAVKAVSDPHSAGASLDPAHASSSTPRIEKTQSSHSDQTTTPESTSSRAATPVVHVAEATASMVRSQEASALGQISPRSSVDQEQSKAAPPQSLGPVQPIDLQEMQRKAPVREMTLRLQAPSGETVSVRLLDQGQQIQIGVRSSDSSIAMALHQDLSSLTANLEKAGLKIDSLSVPTTDAAKVATNSGQPPNDESAEPNKEQPVWWQPNHQGKRYSTDELWDQVLSRQTD